MIKRQPWLLLFITASIPLLFSCKKEIQTKETGNNEFSSNSNKEEKEEKSNTFKGPQVNFGNGKVRSFITINHNGVPLELGVEMTDAALSGLSPDPLAHPSYVIPLQHMATEATPFNHVWINWNVHGHEPEVLFGAPHFDFHFYLIGIPEREAINGVISDMLPPLGYMPSTYFPTPGGVPQMGKHWIDTQHPVAPGTFTQTLIYGSSNHKFTFVEPMITLAYLQSGARLSMPYAQPALFAITNTYYPTVYNIYMDPESRTHYVTLSNFIKR